MMRKGISVTFTIALLVSPLFASADVFQNGLEQARFLLTRMSAVEADFNPMNVRCMVSVSTTTPRIGERFLLAWGSWGLTDTNNVRNPWTQNGAYVIVIDKPGTYRYPFTFYGALGVTTCETRVIVK